MYQVRILVGIIAFGFPLVAGSAWSEAVKISTAEVEEFLHNFESLAARKDFSLLSHMVHEEAVFRFNDGDFIGRTAVKEVFEKTWASAAMVEKEKYYLSEIKVLTTDYNSATATYTYNWEGKYESTPFKIAGRGTRVLVKVDGTLQIVHEHLSRFPE